MKKYFPLEDFRQHQEETIRRIIKAYESGKKHVVLNAPTGSGKSVIAISISNYMKEKYRDVKPSYILTSQKILQEQYHNDFKIPYVKGRGNYDCRRDMNMKLTCDKGICTYGKTKQKCKDCPYTLAKLIAFKADTCVLNYSYFLCLGRTEDESLSNRKLIILDEAHNCEEALIDFSSLTIDKKDLDRYNIKELIFPEKELSDDDKLEWLFTEAFETFDNLYHFELAKLDTLPFDENNISPEFSKQSSKCRYLKEIYTSLTSNKIYFEDNELFSITHRRDIVEGKEEEIFNVRLVFGNKLAHESILSKCDFTLSMSATILSKAQYCRQLALDEKDVEYIEIPSTFPVKNRPVYICNIGSMSYKNKHNTLPKIVNAVKVLLDKHSNERGIIHTVNYDVANTIIKELNNKRLLMPRGKSRDNIIKYFINSKEDNLVLISPSLAEGIDLKDDLARFTIICKMPFNSLADEWIKKRMIYDKEWYGEKTITNLIQMCGRAIRTDKDHAETYILDSDFNYVFNSNRNKIPKWWSESINKL